MRISIMIDDDLMENVLEVTGITTKREAVETGLRLLLRGPRQEEIRELRGKLRWEGNLERMRADSSS